MTSRTLSILQTLRDKCAGSLEAAQQAVEAAIEANAPIRELVKKALAELAAERDLRDVEFAIQEVKEMK